jgi:transcriptional regulator with XRE-family HTH domain
MTIKISDIVDIIESYRNKNAYTHEQMSKLFGMSSRSTYNQFVNKKQNITIQKFLNFLNNTGTSFESFMLKFYKLNDQKNILEAEDFTSPYNVKIQKTQTCDYGANRRP